MHQFRNTQPTGIHRRKHRPVFQVFRCCKDCLRFRLCKNGGQGAVIFHAGDSITIPECFQKPPVQELDGRMVVVISFRTDTGQLFFHQETFCIFHGQLRKGNFPDGIHKVFYCSAVSPRCRFL